MIRKNDNPQRLIPLLVLILALAATGALAEREVRESGAAAADGLVLIENIVGSIQVVGWDKSEILVEGTLGEDVEDLAVDFGRKKSRIKVVYPKKSRNISDGADLVIHVPAGSEVEVECVSASIKVSGVSGEVEISSISGDVTVTGLCRSIEAESISGNVFIDGGAPEVEAASISGKVKVRGDIADVEAATVSGRIDLDFKKFLNLSVESVTGGATVQGDLDREGSFSFEIHSGDLILTIPKDVSADFEIETFSGEIDNDFGQKSRKTSKYAPGRELAFTTGAGEARVRISTFSGDVVIHRK